jgi:nitrate reductase molybdenum cofactor assembly chaperone NarJ/NarW
MRRRHERTPAPWALLSFLLRYPGPDVVAARGELEDEVRGLPEGEMRAALERFLAGWSADPGMYVETFDLRRRASLHLTYYAHGDTRERGMALLRLRKLYRAAGLPMASTELPDHLNVMLAFAAVAPPGHGEALLSEHRAAIELLRLSLHDLDSPYAHLLDAVAAGLEPLSVTERGEVARLAREGPPDEAVGLEPYGPPEAMPGKTSSSLGGASSSGRGGNSVGIGAHA